jgi:putative membrane protein
MQAEPRRLNRWSWIFITAATIRALVVPAIAAIFASGGGVLLWRPELLSLIVIVPSVIYAAIRQRVYSYHLTDGELIVRDGLLFRNLRKIPYERIHNVALVRNPLHRMLGVATVRIETAAGGRPEAVLRVLSLEASEEMRRTTLDETRQAIPDNDKEGAGDAPLVKTPDLELARLGLISNRGLVVVAAVAGVLTQADWWQDWLEETDWLRFYEYVLDHGPGWMRWLLESGPITAKLLVALTAVLLLLGLLRLLSIAWYLVRYRGFTLQRKNRDLQAEYGLLTRIQSVIPIHRIQLVTVTATLLHRLFRRESIEIETAGASDQGEDLTRHLAASGIKFTRQWLAPIVPGDRSARLIRQVMPEIDLDTVDWRPIEARAVRRIVRRFAVIVLPVSLVLTVALTFAPIPGRGLHGLWLPGVVLPLVWLIARRWVRSAGWALTDHAILFRSGWPGRSTSLVRFGNMQSVSLRQSPFDRRHRMATLAVDTAGASSTGHRIRIPYLDETVASKTLHLLYTEGCATEFSW